MADHVAGMVTPGREPEMVQEEEEPDAFWDALGGQTEYHQSKILEVGGGRCKVDCGVAV